MTTYKCLSKEIFQQDNYSIVPIREQDIESIRIWRNEQIKILRQKKLLSQQEQIDYFNNVIKKTFESENPDCILFSFLLDTNCIGYGGLVHINWNLKSAEISLLTETSRSNNAKIYENDFKIFLKLIFQVAFFDLCFDKLTTETYDFRKLTIKILENQGFKFQKRLSKNVFKESKFFDSIFHEIKKSALD